MAAPRIAWSVTPKSAAQSLTSGSMARGTPSMVEQVVAPSALVDVEEQRADGVGGVGGVDAAAGQPPDQERVDGAEAELAALGLRAGALHVVEQPGDLGAGEIGIEQQAGRAR